MVFVATIMPLNAMPVPPQANACQLCAGVPGTQVAAVIPVVGTVQRTSPTSEGAEPVASGLSGCTNAAVSIAGGLP